MANEYRVTSATVEVLHDGAALARVTSAVAEVLHDGAAQARVTSVAIEVLRTVTSITPSTWIPRTIVS